MFMPLEVAKEIVVVSRGKNMEVIDMRLESGSVSIAVWK